MPLPGDYMVTATGGWVAWCIRKICRSKVNHAAIYIGGMRIVEGEPGGAQVSPAAKYPNAIWSTAPLTNLQRNRIDTYAVRAVGTPYNFVDIAVQAVVRVFKWHAPRWALRRASNSHHLQCAQLVDYVYSMSGIQLFADGRPSGLVAPSDLLALIEKG
jgi:hypothetical protein